MENIDKKPVFLAKTLVLKDFLTLFWSEWAVEQIPDSSAGQ